MSGPFSLSSLLSALSSPFGVPFLLTGLPEISTEPGHCENLQNGRHKKRRKRKILRFRPYS